MIIFEKIGLLSVAFSTGGFIIKVILPFCYKEIPLFSGENFDEFN